MNRQSDVIENWEYGLLTLLNNALNLPVSEKNDAIEVKSIIEDVSRKLDSDSIQKFNEYSEDEWNKIIKTADGHGVLPLIADELYFMDCVPDNIKIKAIAKAKRIVIQNSRLSYLTNEYMSILNDAGITAVLLKGAGTAAYYPVKSLRKSGDIDILIPDKLQFDKAVSVLELHGVVIMGEQHAWHHVEMHNETGVIIELHRALAEQFDDDEVNKKIEQYTEEMSVHNILKNIDGMNIVCPEMAWEALSLAIHMLHHFVRAGFGLKLLCDWVVFWNSEHDESQKNTFYSMISSIGITGFVKAVNIICIKYLGMKKENVFFMIHDEKTEVNIDIFLKDIIEAQEFGGTKDERMVVLRGSRLADYVREFHHQMKLNNPDKKDNKLLWPYLWVKTFAVFVRNNRTVRKTTIRSVLKSAGARSRVAYDMKLFKK